MEDNTMNIRLSIKTLPVIGLVILPGLFESSGLQAASINNGAFQQSTNYCGTSYISHDPLKKSVDRKNPVDQLCEFIEKKCFAEAYGIINTSENAQDLVNQTSSNGRSPLLVIITSYAQAEKDFDGQDGKKRFVGFGYCNQFKALFKLCWEKGGLVNIEEIYKMDIEELLKHYQCADLLNCVDLLNNENESKASNVSDGSLSAVFHVSAVEARTPTTAQTKNRHNQRVEQVFKQWVMNRNSVETYQADEIHQIAATCQAAETYQAPEIAETYQTAETPKNTIDIQQGMTSHEMTSNIADQGEVCENNQSAAPIIPALTTSPSPVADSPSVRVATKSKNAALFDNKIYWAAAGASFIAILALMLNHRGEKPRIAQN